MNVNRPKKTIELFIVGRLLGRAKESVVRILLSAVGCTIQCIEYTVACTKRSSASF